MKTRALVAAALCSLAAFGVIGLHRPAVATTPSSRDAFIAALRAHVKHVFVIYQENHTFDNYFGTYPGAENLASTLAQSHGYRQYDAIGKTWITPFRIADPDTESPSQNRKIIEAKMDGGKMDRFVAEQEKKSSKEFDAAGARDVGMIAMSHYDCDTLPYLWKYAHNFALYDHYFQAMAGPSTPNNIEIIAAQNGQSQVARSGGQPVYDDEEPAYGPYEPGGKDAIQRDQQYATLMLTLGGASDAKATRDTAGVKRDLASMVTSGRPAIPWAWYQEGYNGPDATADEGYESHHNAPQYFGYLRQNNVFWNHLANLRALLSQLKGGTLPDRGVFYIKGGSKNQFGWKPVDKDPAVQAQTLGDDDHPGLTDSDHEVGEAFVATFVNAIARSKYWKDSVILITWDDAGGYYDHVPPPQFERCTDGNPCGDGPRLPFLLISPYAKSGGIIHDAGDTSSVVRFAETLFNLPPLASLPDEAPYEPQGPRDANPRLSDLTGGFDERRLKGTLAPLAASTAEIDDQLVNTIPTTLNCASLGITPVHLPTSETPPAGFNPLPSPKP